jgi:hypothetical protein
LIVISFLEKYNGIRHLALRAPLKLLRNARSEDVQSAVSITGTLQPFFIFALSVYGNKWLVHSASLLTDGSYLRQRHSHARIQLTKELFEQLLKACHVFPRFNEYIIGFGSKNSEAEVGPPPLKFRPLCEAQGNKYHGFGAFLSRTS